MGVSVSKRVSEVKQPRGGFLNPRLLTVAEVSGDHETVSLEKENVHATIIGLVVDYMTRYMLTDDLIESFHVSMMGASSAENFGIRNAFAIANDLMGEINGLDDNSIYSACKLVSFDAWFRDPMSASMAKKYDEINADESTIENIRCMIKRSMKFFEIYGPIKKEAFTFEPVKWKKSDYDKMIKTNHGSCGGYTATVSSGDGDFLTEDTMWDFKVSKSAPTSKHTLQLLMYWVMGQHSGQDIYKKITKIGIFNPRLDKVYTYDMRNVSSEVIKTIEEDVICYE